MGFVRARTRSGMPLLSWLAMSLLLCLAPVRAQEGEGDTEAPRPSAEEIEAFDDDLHSWTTYGGDANHDHYTPVRLEPQDWNVRWQVDVSETGPNPKMAAGDGRVFVAGIGANDNPVQLWALDAETGETLWIRPLNTYQSVGAIAYAYGNVYVQTGPSRFGSGRERLRAFRGDTGEALFHVSARSIGASVGPVTPLDGSLFFAESSGFFTTIRRIDAFDGSAIWSSIFSTGSVWNPAVSDEFVHAFVPSDPPFLRTVDRETGALVSDITDEFSYQSRNGPFHSSTILTQDRYALGIDEDRELAIFDVERDVFNFNVPWDMPRVPAVARGLVYRINSGVLYVDDIRRNRNVISVRGGFGGVPFVTNSHLFVSDGSGRTTRAYEVANFQHVWTFPDAGFYAYANESLYILNSSTLTSIAAPEFVPALPVSVEITFDEPVLERTTTPLRAEVLYDDGRRYDRSFEAHWSVDDAATASISSEGVLTTNQLTLPEQPVAVAVRHVEAGVVLEAQRVIFVEAEISAEGVVQRNLARALELRASAHEQLGEAAWLERRSEPTLNEIRRGDREGPPSKTAARHALDALRKSFFNAKMAELFNQATIQKIEETLDAIAEDDSADPGK